MTTNAYLLKGYAQRLYDAGLRRLNVSVDSLKADVAEKIAKKDVLKNVLEGINEALKVGIKVKVNMVPMKGINDHEILDVLEYCKERGMVVRFIEYMENIHAEMALKGLNSEELLSIIQSRYNCTDQGFDGNSPSHYYRLDDGYEFGIIEPHKDDFCTKCNRIRLTAEGNLIPCLYFDEAMSIRDAVRRGDIKEATLVLKEVIRTKPEKNRWSDPSGEVSKRAFYETGG